MGIRWNLSHLQHVISSLLLLFVLDTQRAFVFHTFDVEFEVQIIGFIEFIKKIEIQFLCLGSKRSFIVRESVDGSFVVLWVDIRVYLENISLNLFKH